MFVLSFFIQNDRNIHEKKFSLLIYNTYLTKFVRGDE